MSQGQNYDDQDLPPIHSPATGSTSIISSMFGGAYVERRPMMLGLAMSMIVLAGFIVGTLFTMGILSGLIEIDPKSIKSILRTILGKN